MTFPPADESSQQRRAANYRRANQASSHYRPLRKGRPTPDPAPSPAADSPAAKRANRRRVVLLVVAIVVAVASATAIVGAVLANPATLAQAPQGPGRAVPEPAVQPPPSTGRAAPAEIAPPHTGKSGAPASSTAAGRTGGTAPAPAGGGESVEPEGTAAPATTSTVYYQNCNKAERAGAAPLYPGDPGYSTKLDKDGNGIACDEKDKKKAKG